MKTFIVTIYFHSKSTIYDLKTILYMVNEILYLVFFRKTNFNLKFQEKC